MARGRNSETKSDPGLFRRIFADRARLLGALTTVMSAAIVVTVLATMVVGRGPLLAQAATLRKAKLSVAFDWPPLAGKSTSRIPGETSGRGGNPDREPATWMNRHQRAELEALALKLLTGDPFDRASLERTRDALRETGWFAAGPWLKRHENGVVVISGTWRVPVAAVRTSDGERLVSADGELLLPEYRPGRSGFKVIVGAGPAPERYGEKWADGSVLAGLKLLNYLRPLPGFDQVMGVDVSELATDKRLSILTTTDGRILWGGPPGEFVPGQASAAAKRDRLAMVYSRFGQLDAGRTVVDVRPEDGVYLQDDGYIAKHTTVRR